MADIHETAKEARDAAHKAVEGINAVGKHVKAIWVAGAILAIAVIGIGGQAVGLF